MNKSILKISISTIVIIVLMLIAGKFYMYNNGFSGEYANTEPKEGQIKVACIGDSITYGHGISNWSKNSYPAVLQTLLGDDYHVANFGSSGACVNPEGDQPYISREVYQAALSYDADIIVFMMGTNDSKPENWENLDAFMADYEELLSGLVKGEKTPRIIIGTCAKAFFMDEADISSGLAKYDIQPTIVEQISNEIFQETVAISVINSVDISDIKES